MRSPDLKAIEKIARKARIDLASDRVPHQLMARLYAEQYSISPKDALYEYRTVQRMFPDSCCSFASLYIRNQAKAGDVVDWYYGDYDHTVLNLGGTAIGELTILDITADQFGGPSFYLGALKHPWSK